MKTMIDVYAILKRYGTFIYTGDRFGDLELMEEELKELYKSNMIDPKEFQSALLMIKQEVTRLKSGK
jgi:uncharacterized protein YqgQ